MAADFFVCLSCILIFHPQFKYMFHIFIFICLFVYMQTAEQVTMFCRQQIEYADDEEPKPSIQLSQAQKLRKVIVELVDTERSYVKVYFTNYIVF